MERPVSEQIKLHIKETGEEATLFITDDAAFARQLAKEGKAVLGVLTEKNKEDSFAGVKFLTEGLDNIDEEYLEKVYRRYAKLPWTVLETPRLIIRESVPADVEAFYEIYSEPQVSRFMHDLYEDKNEQIRYMEQYRENVYEFYGCGIWTVVLKETGQVIGRAGFSMRDGFEEPEIGFVVGVPWQRQGIAREACQAILEYGRKWLGFSRVQALVQPENDASIQLLESLGFAPAGEYVEKEISYFRYQKLYR